MATELVTNGTFDTDTTGWTPNPGDSSLAVVSQQLEVTSPEAGTGSAEQIVSGITNGVLYAFSVDGQIGTSGEWRVRVTTGTTNIDQTFTSNTTHAENFTADGTSATIRLQTGSGLFVTSLFDNVSLMEAGGAAPAGEDISRSGPGRRDAKPVPAPGLTPEEQRGKRRGILAGRRRRLLGF